jgi:hypothetical protein
MNRVGVTEKDNRPLLIAISVCLDANVLAKAWDRNSFN